MKVSFFTLLFTGSLLRVQDIYSERVELLQSLIIAFQQELSGELNTLLIPRLSKFQFMLEELSCTLQEFAGKTEKDYSLLEQTIPVECSELLKDLNGYLPYVLRITYRYINILLPYVEDRRQDTSISKTPFRVKNREKTNVIRLLSALYDLRLIELEDGRIPKKEQFMQLIGNYLGVDMKRYEQALSVGLEQSFEANAKIFADLTSANSKQASNRSGNNNDSILSK